MSDHSQTSSALPDCVVDETWSGRTAVLAISGTLDMLTTPKLESAVNRVLQQRPAALIVDLTGVDFLASHGMSVLVDTHDRIGADAAFLVVADGPVTARPLTLTGITEIITVYPTLSQALIGSAA